MYLNDLQPGEIYYIELDHDAAKHHGRNGIVRIRPLPTYQEKLDEHDLAIGVRCDFTPSKSGFLRVFAPEFVRVANEVEKKMFLMSMIK